MIESLSLQAGNIKSNENGHTLIEQCTCLMSQCDYKSLSENADKLLYLAHSNHNKQWLAHGLLYKGISELATGYAEKSLGNLKAAQKLAVEINNDSLMAQVMNSMGVYEAASHLNNYVAQHFFLESLKYADKADFESYKGTIYSNLSCFALLINDTTGLEYAQNTYEYGIKYNKPGLKYVGAYRIASNFLQRKRYEDALKYLDEAINLYHRYGYKNIAAIYKSYAEILTEMGRVDEAEAYVKESIVAAQNEDQLILSEAYYQYARILSKKGMYRESNEKAQLCIEAAEKSSIRTSLIFCYDLMASNFYRIDEFHSAFVFMKKAKLAADSLNTLDVDRLVKERSLIFDLEKKKQEAVYRQQQLDTQRRMSLILVITVVLLISLLTVVITSYQHRNRLYKNIVLQNAKAISKQTELQSRLDKLSSIQQEESGERALKISEDKAQVIYDRLCTLMEKDKLYADMQTSRERLAEMLNTNRTYLSKIIKEKAGMSYSQFINSYRLNEAIRILSDSDLTDYPLKVLSSDLGYSSLSTFYKIFQENIGISPCTYRKQIINMKEHGHYYGGDEVSI